MTVNADTDVKGVFVWCGIGKLPGADCSAACAGGGVAQEKGRASSQLHVGMRTTSTGLL